MRPHTRIGHERSVAAKVVVISRPASSAMAPITSTPAGSPSSKHSYSIAHTIKFKRAVHAPCKWRRSLFIVVPDTPMFDSDCSAPLPAADAEDRIVWGNLDADTVSTADSAAKSTALDADTWFDSAITEWEVPCAHARAAVSRTPGRHCATEDETGEEGSENTDNEADFTIEDGVLQFFESGCCAHAQDAWAAFNSLRDKTLGRDCDGLWPQDTIATYAAPVAFRVWETSEAEDDCMSTCRVCVAAVEGPPAID